MGDNVSFIQVLDTSKLKKDKTSKIKQCQNLAESIGSIIPIRGSKIVKYKIFSRDASEFEKDPQKRNELINYIKGALT